MVEAAFRDILKSNFPRIKFHGDKRTMTFAYALQASAGNASAYFTIAPQNKSACGAGKVSLIITSLVIMNSFIGWQNMYAPGINLKKWKSPNPLISPNLWEKNSPRLNITTYWRLNPLAVINNTKAVVTGPRRRILPSRILRMLRVSIALKQHKPSGQKLPKNTKRHRGLESRKMISCSSLKCIRMSR